jgi:hypothetical protein
MMTALGLCWFLPMAKPVRAANVPYVIQTGCQEINSQHGYSTMNCSLGNVTAGNVIIFSGDQLASALPTITATETFTCPAGAQNVGSLSTIIWSCFVVLASSHTSFTIHVVGTSNLYSTFAAEVQGLGSEDSGARAAANAVTVSSTTAATNEWVYTYCNDFSLSLRPTSPNLQILSSYGNTLAGSDGLKSLSEQQIRAASGAFTTACTQTTDGSSAQPQISVLAFAQSSPPAPPMVQIVQQCMEMGSDQASTCELNNTTSGNKIIVTFISLSNGTAATASCTESCTCPTNSQVIHTYTNQFVHGTCYADTSSGHALFTVSLGGGATDQFMITAMEISGLQTGIDAGSEAAAAATTTSYTTAANNEWTTCSGDDKGATMTDPQVPGNSFLTAGTNTMDNTGGVNIQTDRLTSFAKTTTSSGANTCSYTQASTSTPFISTASFGVASTTQGDADSVILFIQNPFRLNWRLW